jgi:hypothetical protein
VWKEVSEEVIISPTKQFLYHLNTSTTMHLTSDDDRATQTLFA